MHYEREKEIYGYQTLWREIGYYISKLEQYENALKFLDEAIKKCPDDIRALTCRSKTRAKACQYEGAMADITKALGLDPDDIVVLAGRAMNTYLNSEFESGLVQNNRLLPRRQKPDHIAMGVMHCTIAIENCIGERGGRPLRDHFRIIRRLAWKHSYEAQKPYEPVPRRPKKKKKVLVGGGIEIAQKARKKTERRVSVRPADEEEGRLSIKDSLHSVQRDELVIPKFSGPFPFRPMQYHTTNIRNFMAEKYLDSMYLEKIFLKDLQTVAGAKCPNQKGSEKIMKLAKDGFKVVHLKQELLRARRPFYHIKYQEVGSSARLKQRQNEQMFLQMQTTKKDADALLAKLYDALEKKQLNQLLAVAEKLRAFCESKLKRILPDKEYYQRKIYEIIRKGYYQMYRLNKEQYVYDQSKRILVMLQLPLDREPSQDSVIEQIKNVRVDYRKQIELFENRVLSAETVDETCWCYHELSRYQMDVKRYDLAKVYSKKCIIESGVDGGRPEWEFNATMLLVKLNVLQKNKNDALKELAVAVELAKQLGDRDMLSYLARCKSVIDSISFDGTYGSQELEKRQQRLLTLMTTAKMKEEFAYMFKMMNAMPASRRMMLMPGARAQEVKVVKKRPTKAASTQTPRDDSKNDTISLLDLVEDV